MMSGFFGIFHPEGIREHSDFDQMKQVFGRESHDKISIYTDKKISIGSLLPTVAADQYFQQPIAKSKCGRYLLAGHVRLDYRDDLGDKLGYTQEQLMTIADADLIILAYQKWSDACVQHLEGDWVIAIFDCENNQLFLAKDATGISALFYVKINDSFYFSSDPTVFAKCSFFPIELDDVQFIFSSVQGLKIEKGKTLYKSLYVLENGSYIKVGNDLQVSQFTYFDVLSIKVSRKYKFDQDVFFEFKSAFQAAVKTRLRGTNNTGIFLSSGFDSMSVFSVAVEELHYLNRGIYTYTSIPSKASPLTELEKQYADESLLVKNVVAAKSNTFSFFTGFDNFSFGDELSDQLGSDPFMPFLGLNRFWINGILNEGRQKGINTFLTGQMGNFTLSNDGYFVHAEMLLKLKLKSLFLDLKASVQQHGGTIFGLFVKRVYPVLKNQCKFLKYYHALFKASFFKQLGVLDYQVYKKYFADFDKRRGEWVPNYFLPSGNRKIRQQQLNKYLYYGNIDWYLHAMYNRVEVADPTSDKRFITLSLSIDDLWFSKFGESKYLYKGIFQGLVDEQIINSKKSKIQSFDFLFRIQQDKSFLPAVEKICSNLDEFDFVQKNQIQAEALALKKAEFTHENRVRLVKFLHKISLLNFLASVKTCNFR